MEMTEHPLAAQRFSQKQMLDSLPEDQREEHAYLFRVGNLSYRYYMELLAEPTQDDFDDWLMGLPEHIAKDMRQQGYEECKTHIPLRRHAAERNDLGYRDFMKKHLSEEDYKQWETQYNSK